MLQFDMKHMDTFWKLWLLIMTANFPFGVVGNININGIRRINCENKYNSPIKKYSEYSQRLIDIREQMKIRASTNGKLIDAYIVTTFDDHLNDDTDERDKRLKYLCGFSGISGIGVVTLTHAALWTDERYLGQADEELDCDWKIFNNNNVPSIPEWLKLRAVSKIGADPHSVPHFLWFEWSTQFYRYNMYLVKINVNLIDIIWLSRPEAELNKIQIHPKIFTGVGWLSKVHKLRNELIMLKTDAIIVTSLTEIAYLLNLRGKDLPHTPVFKAYLIVTHDETILFINPVQVHVGLVLHLKSNACHDSNCVMLRDYNSIWSEIRKFSQIWRRVLLPKGCAFDMGVSEAIYSTLRYDLVYEDISPIILMRASKTDQERKSMRVAHILDGAAMCDALSYIEERILAGDILSEMFVAKQIDLSRRIHPLNRGLSMETVVSFGPHSSLPSFMTRTSTNIPIWNNSTVIINSGGQYLQGTTEVSRTLHYGIPTYEQRQAYTNVLRSIVSVSTLIFPETLTPSEIDTLSRGPVWRSLNDYPQATGHGIGSYLSVHESPINIAHSTSQDFYFKDGYFITNEPAYYKRGSFGIRLENVLEVSDTGKTHPAGYKFLYFQDVTLVPYEPKLIDRKMLSVQEKKWLNDYNSKIRALVGDELKKQGRMRAFYWMMNKTKHVIEYLPKSDYRQMIHNNACEVALSTFLFPSLLIISYLLILSN